MIESLTITTNASGDATAYTQYFNGILTMIRYVATDYAATVDFAITGETTGQIILTAANVSTSAVYQPVRLQHVNTTAASTGVYGPISIPNERIKIVISSGGDTKVGQFIFVTA